MTSGSGELPPNYRDALTSDQERHFAADRVGLPSRPADAVRRNPGSGLHEAGLLNLSSGPVIASNLSVNHIRRAQPAPLPRRPDWCPRIEREKTPPEGPLWHGPPERRRRDSGYGLTCFSFAEHLRHHIDTGGPDKAPSAEQVGQGILSGGENKRHLSEILHRNHLLLNERASVTGCQTPHGG
jgi:hypothetical protein